MSVHPFPAPKRKPSPWREPEAWIGLLMGVCGLVLAGDGLYSAVLSSLPTTESFAAAGMRTVAGAVMAGCGGFFASRAWRE